MPMTSHSQDTELGASTTETRPSLRHLRALDGVRGAAIVAVLLFHSGYMNGGYLGVDLFFVLSGFLITSLLLTEWRQHRGIRLSAFWARRARRLLPALFLMLAGVALYAAFVAQPSQVGQIRGDELATLGYVANWRQIIIGGNYFAIFGAPSPLNHTWSLAIEEQFYLIWPLVIVGLAALAGKNKRLAPRVFVTALLGTLALGTFTILYALSGGSGARIYFGTDTRAPAILLGAALAAAVACWGSVRSPVGRVGVELAGFAGVAWLAWAWFDLGGQDPFLERGGLLLCGVAGVAVIAAAAHPQRGPIAAALSLRPLVWLGLISYGLYLWHWPIFVWLNPDRLGMSGWALFGVRVAVTLAVSIASYVLVEQPIRHGALRGWRIRVLTPAAVAATICVVLVGTSGATTEPTVASSVTAGRQLVTQGTPAPSVGVPRVLVVGDSVAVYLAPSLTQVQSAMGVQAFSAGVPSCEVPRAPYHREPASEDGPPTEAIPNNPACSDWANRWADQLAQVQPQDVVLLLGFPAVEDFQVNGKWRTPCTAPWSTYYRGEMVAALRTLGSTGARVWVTTAAPPDAFYFPASLTPQTGCLNRVLRSAAATTHTSVIDVASYVCPKSHCQQYIDGQEMRPDGFHYSGGGGALIARYLISRVTQPPPTTTPTTASSRR
jgi:peptidoglycan/LPS O-acetylase OafA/YrhL